MISPELKIGKLYVLPFKYLIFDMKNEQRYTGHTTLYKTYLTEGTPVLILNLQNIASYINISLTKYLIYRILCPDGNIVYIEVTDNAIKGFWKEVKI
jgi:hypothetical protein